MLPAANVTLADPKNFLKTYVDKDTGSGRTVPRRFCSNCGSGIGTVQAENNEGNVFVCVGLFPRIPKPEAELFASHRQEWVQPIEGAAQYPLNPGRGPQEAS